MRVLRLLVALLVMSTLFAPATAAGGLSPGLLASINGAIAALNADDAAKIGAYFTSDAVVIDDAPPYFWTAPNAATHWWGDIDAILAKLKITHLHAMIGTITQSSVSANRAYVVVPLVITSQRKGKAHQQTGLWALTLRHTPVGWKIASAAWARMAMSP